MAQVGVGEAFDSGGRTTQGQNQGVEEQRLRHIVFWKERFRRGVGRKAGHNLKLCAGHFPW